MKLRKNLKKGFTLIELVVVIAVIAILSAVSVAAYFGVINSSRESVAQQEAEQIVTSITTVTTAEEESVKEVFGAEITSSGLEVTFKDSKTTYDSTADSENYADVNLIGIFDYLLQVSDDAASGSFSLPSAIANLTTTATKISKFYGLVDSNSSSKTATIYGFDYTYKDQTAQVTFGNATITSSTTPLTTTTGE